MPVGGTMVQTPSRYDILDTRQQPRAAAAASVLP